MPYTEVTGNLFSSRADALVNTVNCVGPMGKGVALEFRRRFPDMFEVYKGVCERGELRPGSILPYRKSTPWVLNFAVKDNWKNPSKEIWVEQCLEKFCNWYPRVGLKSVAFPWMGAMNGGIPLETIKRITRHYLSHLEDIEIEVYSFDPNASDPLFDTMMRLHKNLSAVDFAIESKIRRSQIEALYSFLDDEGRKSMSQIVASNILGKASIDKLYLFLTEKMGSRESPTKSDQLDLFS